MKYEVIARKFRPQVFDEVVGQTPIVQTLRNAIDLKRVGHAYLFCGPRGVGKTTTARILAKGLNCAEGPTTSPCNQCDSCRGIAAGQSIDVLEIDAASNTGVDSIRELRENARYAPSRDRNKIFIIDEVHMLSTSAFNALLKILEEPPAHVVFIMATTERHKLPGTILSRCQQFVFRSIPAVEILAHLKAIVAREGVRIEEQALNYIVRASEGSMRDAQSLLDQIIAFGGQNVENADVRDVLGFIPDELLNTAVTALGTRDARTLVENVGVVVDQGLNLQQYVREVSGRVRELLLVKLGLSDRVLGSDADRERITASSHAFSEQELIRFLDVLLKLENDLRWTSQPRFHAEAGFAKMARMGRVRDLEDVLRELRTEPNSTSPARDSGRHPTPPAKAVEKPAPPPQSEGTPVTLDPVARFSELVDERSTPTAVLLQRAQSIRFANGQVSIEFRDPVHLAQIDSGSHRAVLNEAAAAAFGTGTVTALTLATVRPGAEAGNESLMDRAKAEPLVQQFVDVFRGDLAQVKLNRKS